MRDDLGEVSHQAVYDVLRALTATGLVRRRFQPTGSVARYEARVGDNHHHVVCRSCGAIADVDCAVGYTACLTAADDSGYEITEAEVIYWADVPSVSKQPAINVKTTDQRNSETGEGPTCLITAAKAKTQQSPPRLPSRLGGPGRTRTGGRIS